MTIRCFLLTSTVLAGGLVAAGCQGDRVEVLPSALEVESSSVDFGDVPAGEFRKQRTTIRVVGDSYVDLDAPVLRDQDRPVFELASNVEPGRLNAGSVMVLEVTYRPPSVGRDGARVTVAFSHGGEGASIELLGHGICPTGQVEVQGGCVEAGIRLDAGTVDASAPDAARTPEEVCDGLDNDGDGRCDELFACCSGTTVSCRTWCGSTGTGTCTAGCGVPELDACVPPTVESCNGIDDNCDCRIDEGCPNSVENPGFENGLVHWSYWVDEASGAAAAFTVERGAGCDGSAALRIDVSAVSEARCGAYSCAHTIELRRVGFLAVEGKRPRVSLRVRSSGVPAMSVGFRQLCGGACGAPACPQTCPADARNETDPFSCCWEPYAGPEYSVQLTGSGWQTITYTFPPIVIQGPDDTRQDGRILFGVGTAVGTVWLDDIHLDLVE